MHHSLLIVFPGSPRRLSLISADSCQPPPSSLPFIFPLVWHWGFALFSCRLLCSNQLLLDLERRAGPEGSQYLFMYDRDELADFHFRQTNRNWFHSTSCSIVNSRRFCRHRTTGRPQTPPTSSFSHGAKHTSSHSYIIPPWPHFWPHLTTRRLTVWPPRNPYQRECNSFLIVNNDALSSSNSEASSLPLHLLLTHPWCQL